MWIFRIMMVLAILIFGAVSSMCQNPSFSDRQRTVDQLASREAIQTLNDAQAYVNAIFPFTGAELAGADQLKARLARSELAAMQDPSKRVSEQSIADEFNAWVAEIGAPPETRITAKELHYWRDALGIMFKNVISHTSNGKLSAACRPVEAAHLLLLLRFNHGIPKAVRHAAEKERPISSLAKVRTGPSMSSDSEQSQLVPLAPNPTAEQFSNLEVAYVSGKPANFIETRIAVAFDHLTIAR